MSVTSDIPRHLGLRVGDTVEVRSAEEILESLDADGRLDALTFMPEMLPFCGRRFRVSKVAHKTCDTIHKTGCRRMTDTVHLEDLRCDGGAHGGCGATCLLFWKESWLRRVRGSSPEPAPRPVPEHVALTLARTVHRRADPEAWTCQTTQLFDASMPLHWWDPRQYVRDLSTGNVGLFQLIKVVALAAFNVQQRWRGGRVFPVLAGTQRKKTPAESLGLQPGEWVQVKTKAEIEATLDERNKNRGMLFDPELLPYCGGTFRVASRVEKIINEKTGRMMDLPNDCIILEGVVCTAVYSRKRLFCPRAITPYWREIWLRRVER